MIHTCWPPQQALPWTSNLGLAPVPHYGLNVLVGGENKILALTSYVSIHEFRAQNINTNLNSDLRTHPEIN